MLKKREYRYLRRIRNLHQKEMGKFKFIDIWGNPITSKHPGNLWRQMRQKDPVVYCATSFSIEGFKSKDKQDGRE